MTEENGLSVYLNDHLGGATTGAEMARHLAETHRDDPLGKVLSRIADEIEQDRQTLATIVEKVGVSASPLKQAGGWLAEKMSRFKLGPHALGPGDLLAVETLSLGVEGKACLWRALQEVGSAHPGLAEFDFGELTSRAERQRAELEAQRLTLAAAALT